MPDVQGYFDADLSARVVVVSPDGVTVAVHLRDRPVPVCDLMISQSELRALLARCDQLAASEPAAAPREAKA